VVDRIHAVGQALEFFGGEPEERSGEVAGNGHDPRRHGRMPYPVHLELPEEPLVARCGVARTHQTVDLRRGLLQELLQ
jgi:hypothetical protein